MKFTFLKNINYAILHGWQGLPEYLPSDLDIVVAPEELPKLEKALLEAKDAQLVNLLQHESTCFYFVLSVQEGERVRFLPVDAATDYRRDGRVLFSAEELLQGRRPWNGFWVSAPEVEFRYLLVKKVLKEALPGHARERLQELVKELGEEAGKLAKGLLGEYWGQQVVTWISSGKWELFEKNLKSLKRQILWQRVFNDPLNPFRYWFPEIGRIWKRWLYPTGLFVVVLGPDGSGKSTLIENLKKELSGAFRRVEALHFIPDVLKRRKAGIAVTNPHGKPPRSLLLSFAKLIYYVTEYTLGYLFRIRPYLVRSTLVLFDRYYDDMLVDPKRYRYGGPGWLVRFFKRFVPRPDLFLILDLPEKDILERKQEVSENELKRQRIGYLELASKFKNAFILDASRAPEVVLQAARDAILNYLSNRYLERRKHYFRSDRGETLRWLSGIFGVNVGLNSGTGKKFIWLSFPDGRGFLLPASLTSGKAISNSLCVYNTLGIKGKVGKSLLKACLKLGVVRKFFPEVFIDFKENSLLSLFKDVFGCSQIEMSVSLGTPGPHRKPVIQVMDGEGSILGYAKVGWNEVTSRLVENEARALSEVNEESISFKVPRLLFSGAFGNGFLCVQSAPASEVSSTPRGLNREYVDFVKELAKGSIDHKPLEESTFWNRLRQKGELISNSYYRHVFKQGISYVSDKLRGKEIPFHRCHGEFAPWNSLKVDGTIYVFDWEYYQSEAPAGYDIFHFLVNTKWFFEKKSPGEIIKDVSSSMELDYVKDYWQSVYTSSELIKPLFLLYLLDRLTLHVEESPSTFDKLGSLRANMIYLCVVD